MMMSRSTTKVGRNTPLGKLKPGVFRQISNMLDPDRKWAELAEHIIGRNGQPKFDYQRIRILALALQRPNGSPTREMLDAWSMDNPTLDQLIEALLDAELYSVADYLAIDILRESPSYRAGTYPPNTASIEIRDSQSVHSSGGMVMGSPEPPGLLSAAPNYPQIAATFDNNALTNNNTDTSEKPSNVPSIPQPDSELQSAGERHAGTTASAAEARFEDISQLKKELKKGDVNLNLVDVNNDKFQSENCKSDPGDKDLVKESDHREWLAQNSAHWSPGCCPLCFPHHSLELITDNFNRKPLREGGRYIGKGGFGEVFHGKIGNIEVAVKILSRENMQDYAVEQFHTEIRILSGFQHENLLSLVGYSEAPSFSLVYLYMPNGSLEDRLACEGNTSPLSIQQRISIAKGIARGINCLHTSGEREIIHRDIKSANVLLDSNWVAKIGDCGLGHYGPSDPTKNTHTFTDKVIGTSAYIPPEYRNWEVSVKLDAYAYGVVLLEILTGEPAFDMEREDRDLATHIRENCEDIMTMVDLKGGKWVEDTARTIYAMCLQLLEHKRKRPKISEVLQEIESWPEV